MVSAIGVEKRFKFYRPKTGDGSRKRTLDFCFWSVKKWPAEWRQDGTRFMMLLRRCSDDEDEQTLIQTLFLLLIGD
jgi:hypothetical protein